MAYIKLDCGILNSSLWVDSDARNIFLTALLLAEPIEIKHPTDTIEIRSLKLTKFVVPPGWYGLAAAAATGIAHHAGIPKERALDALERLAAEEPESRSQLFGGRRLVRIDGGFVALNYDVYRFKDHGSKERVRRHRARIAENTLGLNISNDGNALQPVTVTQAEAEAEAYKEVLGKKDSLGDFIAKIKANPAYSGIDIEKELHKMDIWLQTPKGKGRRKTHRFILNWFNRCEASLPPSNGQVKRVLSRGL